MNKDPGSIAQILPRGVMLNAYPDSIGERLADTVELLKRPEFRDVFSLFYILPTFFNSDLDRGFSIIDYNINEALVSPRDLDELNELGIMIKFDMVLNHLSVRSPQFQDMLLHGDDSPHRDFFIDWNEFWDGHGTLGEDGTLVPDKEHLDKLFMRKPGLPVLKVRFPDGALKTYWNTFYQKVDFDEITVRDFADIEGIDSQVAATLAHHVKILIKDKDCLKPKYLEDLAEREDIGHLKAEVIEAVCRKRDYLGQMDINACSELVWEFYDETLKKLGEYGARIVRLDAFAYLHKEPGQPNFFNRPGTWEYLERLRGIAKKYELIIFPEIHAEYGAGIHEEIAQEGYPIYDFFFPGLVIDALDRGSNEALLRWAADIQARGLQTINMLGSHDGIPMLDLRGKQVDGTYRPGLLDDEQIEAAMERILDRGGRTKNLYGADGKKIDYYQINATFFSALGEDEQKLRLARAIQMFIPGVPQVWYLDLFAGKNDYAAADKGDTAKHKEINRTTLTLTDIEAGLERPVVLDQLELIRLRNTSAAFEGEMEIIETEPHLLHICWQHPEATATLKADLRKHSFTVYQGNASDEEVLISFES
ncbi:MAG: glycosidase [Pseudomonadota bacterium]